jgi:cation transport ATPase
MRITLSVEYLHKNNAEEFERQARSVAGVSNVETWQGRAEIELNESSVQGSLVQKLKASGFVLLEPEQSKGIHVARVYVDGMTCRSCEITIERKFSKLPWVKQVDVNAGKGMA